MSCFTQLALWGRVFTGHSIESFAPNQTQYFRQLSLLAAFRDANYFSQVCKRPQNLTNVCDSLARITELLEKSEFAVAPNEAPFWIMDRRKHKRFDLSAPATYSWDEGGARRNGLGTTENLSECGLYVLGDSSPPPGTTIQFEVLFSFGDDSKIRMQAQGKVIRVEAHQDKPVSGFAAETPKVWLGKDSHLPKPDF